MAKLQLRDVEVRFGDRLAASVAALDVDAGEIVGLAGESGSGKSMTIQAVLGLAGTVGASVTGSIRLDGDELTAMSRAELRAVSGRRIAAIFQSPGPGLQPGVPGRRHRDQGAAAARAVGRRGPRARRRGHAQRPAAPGTAAPLPVPAVRRPAAAGGDRARPRAARRGAARRRADERPGRHRAGRGARPPAGAAGLARHGRSCSSATTSRSSPSCATGSRSCAPGRSSSRAAPRT